MKLAFVLITLILVGCEKPYNKNLVNVHAYNALDSSGIEGVYVAVYKEPNGDLGKEKIAAEGYTNTDGELTLTYKKFKLFKAFQLYDYFDNEEYEKIKMYRNGVEWNGEGQTGGTKVTDFEISYAPVCRRKTHYLNQNCFNMNDTLYLWQWDMVEGDTTFYGSNGYSLTSCFDYTSPAFQDDHAGYRTYFGYIKRDNGTTYFDTLIYFHPWQDNLIELYF